MRPDKQIFLPLALTAALGLAIATDAGAAGSVMKQCGDKWQAAKAAGQVPAGQTWSKFLSRCRADLAKTPKAAAATSHAAEATPPAAKTAAAPQTAVKTAPKMAATPASPGREAALTRQRQCGAEWKANTAALKAQYGSWPKYWSACNIRLKTTGK
jgi:hypothetical protein